MTRPAPDARQLAASLSQGDRRSLARAISLVERGDPAGDETAARVAGRAGMAQAVGVTGAGGVGKSTLISALVAEYRRAGRRVAVLSVDPSSPFTSGALLGDRVRMLEHDDDQDVFVRSMASRGATGGLARAAHQAIVLMGAAGFDPVLVETTGVGQGDVEIASYVDTVVCVIAPGAGDSLQLLKTGVMEIPDVIALNKSDHPLAAQLASDLRKARAVRGSSAFPPVVETDALRGHGIEALRAAIADHARGAAGGPAERRRRRLTAQSAAIARAEFEAALRHCLGQAAAESIFSSELSCDAPDPRAAARRLLSMVLEHIRPL